MSARTNGVPAARPAAEELPLLGGLVLTRVCCQGGATRAELARDLAPLFSEKLSSAEWRRKAEAEATRLVAAGFATERRGRLVATDAGTQAAIRFAGPLSATTAWTDVRNTSLVAKALGAACDSPQKRKALTRPAGLRAFILQAHYGLPLKPSQSPTRLRSELAVVALERAFGNKIKSGLGAHAGLSAKAARLLAGQLAKKPRDFGTDARLIAALAAEVAGAAQTDEESLRLALLRRLAASALGVTETPAAKAPAPAPAARVKAVPRAANDMGPAPAAMPAPQPVRPDLVQFSADVLEAARGRAEGWSGNRKAFISHVWQAIRARRPEWVLSEIEFKCMLAEAHRAGRVVLANADLKDKSSLKELRESAVAYKNTVWHFVRVED